jgi:hypothetical protein
VPIQIDEVQSNVTVDPPAHGTSPHEGRVLPTAKELARFAQLARHLDLDEARIRARDHDD